MRLALLVPAALVWLGVGCAPGAPEPGDVYTDVVVRVTSLGSCPGLTIDAGATSWHADEPDFTLDVDGTTGTLTVLAGDGDVLRARFDSTDGDASMFFNNWRFLEYACA